MKVNPELPDGFCLILTPEKEYKVACFGCKTSLVKNGKDYIGHQKWQCPRCGKGFIEGAGRRHRISDEIREFVRRLHSIGKLTYVEIGRVFRIDPTSVSKIIKEKQNAA